MVSKLMQCKPGSVPPAPAESRRKVGKESVKELLVALPGDFEGDVAHFPPNVEMATALATSNMPVAYIRMSAWNASSMDKLNAFLTLAATGGK